MADSMNEKNTIDPIKPKAIEVSVLKAATIVITAVLASAGASVWGTLSLVNTVPFRVEAIEIEIDKIQAQIDGSASIYMPRELSEEKWSTNTKDHQIIDKKLDQIITNQNILSNNQQTLLQEIER